MAMIEYPKIRGKTAKEAAIGFRFAWFCVLWHWLTDPKDFRYDLQRILFPGDAAVALAELEHLAVNLQSGTPLGQALEAFAQAL